MKIRHLIATSACIFAVGTATFAQEEPTAATVLATVNGTQITVGHVIALTDRLPEQYQSIPDADLYKGVLEQLIYQTAISTKTDRNTASVKLALDNEIRALLAGVTLDRIGQEAASEEAIKAAYETQYGNTPPTVEYKASHILVEKEERAKELVEELAGGADFAVLARDNSTGPTAPNGGDLGWFPADRMVPEFGTALKDMAAGDVSGPVKTQFGWHVIKLFETRDVPPPALSSVRDQIAADLNDAAVKAAIEQFQKDASIERVEVDIDPAIIRQQGLLD